MSGPSHAGYRLFADILRSTLPRIQAFGVATPDTVDVETYARRLADEIAANDAMACCGPAIAAWTIDSTAGRDRSNPGRRTS